MARSHDSHGSLLGSHGSPLGSHGSHGSHIGKTPFISTVKAGRKLVTPKGKNSVTNAIVLVAISITDSP